MRIRRGQTRVTVRYSIGQVLALTWKPNAKDYVPTFEHVMMLVKPNEIDRFRAAAQATTAPIVGVPIYFSCQPGDRGTTVFEVFPAPDVNGSLLLTYYPAAKRG